MLTKPITFSTFSLDLVPSEIAAIGPFENVLPSVTGYRINLNDSELATHFQLPDTKVHRLLSRAGLFMQSHFKLIDAELSQLNVPRDRVGIFSAVQPGPIDYEISLRISKEGDSRTTSILRDGQPPKQIFKYGPNIPVAQLAIFLKVTGPLFTFTDWNYGGLQAIDAATFALKKKEIDVAILLSAFSCEDPLANVEHQRRVPVDHFLTEGSAGFLFTRHSLPSFDESAEAVYPVSNLKRKFHYFGPAHLFAGINQKVAADE